MKTIGIVGSEAIKFTEMTEFLAKETIRSLVLDYDKVVSGGCHLGGIDAWAIEIAKEDGKEWEEFLPRNLSWERGYKERNLKIAKACDKCVCITVKTLPDTYGGMRFSHCYHCGTPSGHHVKSGGCWTMKKAKEMGKETQLIVI
jgi:hypothetical protein